jgi:hypothetical protein
MYMLRLVPPTLKLAGYLALACGWLNAKSLEI